MIKKTLNEFKKEGYLERDDFLFMLEDYYFIKITPRTLKYYATIGLIDPGIKENIKGIVGSVSIYHKKNLEVIHFIKWLQVELNMTLNKISEYFNILRIDDTNYKKFIKKFKEYSKGNPEEKLKKIINERPKKILGDQLAKEQQWAKELSRVYKYKESFWKDTESFLRKQEYVTELGFIAKNKALIETGLLGVDFKGDIEKYLLAGKVMIGKDFIKVIFKEPVMKEVTFLKNKIDIIDLKA